MEFEDFFDRDEGQYPFESAYEITDCYIRWYDMFLAAQLESIKGADRQKLIQDITDAGKILEDRMARTDAETGTMGGALSITDAAGKFGLTDFSFFCLIMSAAQEMDGRYVSGYGLLSEDDNVGCPTFALAERLYSFSFTEDGDEVDRSYRNSMSECPLFNIHRSPKGKGSLFDTFEAGRQFAALLKGDFSLGEELSYVCQEKQGHEPDDAIVHREEAKSLNSFLKDNSDKDSQLIIITGAPESGGSDLVLHAIGSDRMALYFDFNTYLLMDRDAAREIASDTIARARLLDRDLIIRHESGKGDGALWLFLDRAFKFLNRIFVITDDEYGFRSYDDIDKFEIKLMLPTALEQEKAWRTELEKHSLEKDIDPAVFAKKYRLHHKAIQRCVETAANSARYSGRSRISFGDITGAVLENTTSDLDKLSRRVPLKFSWEDLVVEDSQRVIMETLVNRVRNQSIVDEEWGFNDKLAYGKGVSMILYGSPGTGKTMAAQVMAKEIGMALYRVDLSQLVDKYIGETEKNIGKIFDAASDGNVILFFDEADSLFSKRTEVSNSNDKHANTEVAYLLQRIEQYDGVTFLATNRFQDFDAAFIRRITYAVRMDKPDADRRLQLFEKTLPHRIPRDKNLDLKYFADSFELSGSEIKEILYSAAFIAAADSKVLSNRHISQAIRYQQEKTGNVFQGDIFARYLN